VIKHDLETQTGSYTFAHVPERRFPVIPAKARIQRFHQVPELLDPGFNRGDVLLGEHLKSMIPRNVTILFCFVAGVFLSGCVGHGAYEKKLEEASALSREARLMRQDKMEISLENDELKSELAASGRKVTALEQSKKKLEDVIAEGSDRAGQRLIELERENSRLKAEVDRLLRGHEEDVRGVSRHYENLIERFKDEIARGHIKLAEFRGRITMTVNSAVLFDEGADILKPSGTVLLQRIAETLKELGAKDVQVGSAFTATASDFAMNNDSTGPWNFHAGRAIAVARVLGASGRVLSDMSTIVNCGIVPDEKTGSALGPAFSEPIEIAATIKD
jgi:flagellar motor protein MotB